LDKAIIDKARSSDVVAFFERYHGFTFSRSGSEFRCNQHKSLSVSDNRLSWFWHSKGIGGYGALDYLIKVENMPFRSAVETLIGSIPTSTVRYSPTTSPPKTLILPERSSTALKLHDYLCNTRGIDGDVVNWLTQKKMIYEDLRGNVVFVGSVVQGNARFASLRGTHNDFRGDCSGSDKRYGWCMIGRNLERLYVFESPIDCMSHATIANEAKGSSTAWKQQSRLSLSGTCETALIFFLSQPENIQTRELVFCLDNDTAGREAAMLLSKKYADEGYSTRIVTPQGKDFNDDLLEHRRQMENRLTKGARR
jgi:hypothetical protein